MQPLPQRSNGFAVSCPGGEVLKHWDQVHQGPHEGHVLQDDQVDEIGVDYLAAWVRPGDHSVSLGWGVRGGFGGAIVVS